jgi:hypothetical protein
MLRAQKAALGAALLFASSLVAVAAQIGGKEWDQAGAALAQQFLDEGKQVFRFDTFGSEDFWGGKLKLHEAVAGKKLGGIGPGLSPEQALKLGLKVDIDAIPKDVAEALDKGKVDLSDPASTVLLLKAKAVVGLTGFFSEDGKKLKSIGIQCALCHSTVDDAYAPGIGKRLDGWPNRDLDVGAIIALAPDLSAFTEMLRISEADVKKAVRAWGPGKFDAELNLDGKAFRPDGKTSATLNPPAFGLAGVNNHTWTGSWGTVTYWNAYVANLEMHGKGTFFDPRLDDAKKYPVAARTKQGHKHDAEDLITAKLPSLHFYQLSLQRPSPQMALSTRRQPRKVRHCSTARPNAAHVTCRRFSPNRAGICTRPKKSGSMISRLCDRPMAATGRCRCALCGAPTRSTKAVFIMMADLEPWKRSWTTTTSISASN